MNAEARTSNAGSVWVTKKSGGGTFSPVGWAMSLAFLEGAVKAELRATSIHAQFERRE